jgi:hypothetical protein
MVRSDTEASHRYAVNFHTSSYALPRGLEEVNDSVDIINSSCEICPPHASEFGLERRERGGVGVFNPRHGGQQRLIETRGDVSFES